MACASDYFLDLPEYGLIVCRSCFYAVWPDQVRSHLKAEPHLLAWVTTKAIAKELKGRKDLYLSTDEHFELPRRIEQAIPQLPLYRDGLQYQFQYQLDPCQCTFVCGNDHGMRSHWRKAHQWSLAEGRPGGGGPTKQREIAKRRAEAVAPVHCQRFFRANKYSQYFEVSMCNVEQRKEQVEPDRSLESIVLEELDVLESRQQQGRQIVCGAASSKQVSPFLDLTRWPSYLEGHKFAEVAALGNSAGSRVGTYALCDLPKPRPDRRAGVSFDV